MCYNYYCKRVKRHNHLNSICRGSSNYSYNIIRNDKELLTPPQIGDNILGFGIVYYIGIFRSEEEKPIIFIK